LYYNLNFLSDGTRCQDFETSLTTSVHIFLSFCLSILHLSFFLFYCFFPLSGQFFRVLWSFFVVRVFKIVKFLWLYKLFHTASAYGNVVTPGYPTSIFLCVPQIPPGLTYFWCMSSS